MKHLSSARLTRNSGSAAIPFRSVGIVPLGDGANLTVQIGTTGGARVLNLRNEMRQGRAGVLPVGVGALVGADYVPALIALLQRAADRKRRPPGDRIRELSAKWREAETRALFFEGEVRALDEQSRRKSIVIDALLKKLPEDVRDKLMKFGVEMADTMADTDFGALLVRIESTRDAQ